MRNLDKRLNPQAYVPNAVANRPPPKRANAAQLVRRGGAARWKSRKAQRCGYRPRPFLLQAGGAR
jgi:hypothetical protein